MEKAAPWGGFFVGENGLCPPKTEISLHREIGLRPVEKMVENRMILLGEKGYRAVDNPVENVNNFLLKGL